MAEINIVKMSRILHESNSRIESEFYLQEYANNKKVLNDLPHVLLHELLEQPVKTGHTPSMKNRSYYGDEVAFIKTDNLHDNIINDTFKDHLSSKGNALLKGSALRKDDILTTIIGATFDVVPRSSIVPDSILPANINQNIALIRVAPKKAVPEFISIYLNSKYGKTYLRYLSRQTGQVNLNCREVEQVIVPLLSQSFQNHIGDKVKQAYKLQKEAKNCYADAEKHLLKAIGLSNFVQPKSTYFIKTISDSFRASDRIDAEFYQQYYDNIEKVICSHDTTLCQVNEGIFTASLGNYKYIELANIGLYGNVTGCTIAQFDKLPSRARRMVRSGQVIVSSIEGSLSSCALISSEYDGALCSTGFYIVESTSMNSETLLVLFKSAPIQALMQKWCSGTILAAISKSALEKIPLPIIATTDQNEIASYVNRSFSLRCQSDQLLDKATRAVEIAVQDSEERAMKFLIM